MAGNKNSGNRTDLEKLQYQGLLNLGVVHLTKRMKSKKCSARIKDHIALTLVSRAIPQAMEHSGAVKVSWEQILNDYDKAKSSG